MKNILELIERSAKLFPKNIAVAGEENQFSYEKLIRVSKAIGSYLSRINCRKRPIAIYMEKTPDCVAAMLGILYSGNFYVVLDTKMPEARAEKIFESLKPVAIFTEEKNEAKAKSISSEIPVVTFEEAYDCECDDDLLHKIRRDMTATDPMYVLYTSGSTGLPKGAVINHQAVLAYIKWYVDTFEINENTVFGSQTPFYFSMSVSDLYGALVTGARLQIIEKTLFSFPLMLIEYMNQFRINTIYWVPSALCLVANWDTFAYGKPEYLEKVLFAGEVMPCKQLNYWRRHFPDCLYANLFGPTETTDICSYYIVKEDPADDTSLPIGYACDNCGLLVVDDAGDEAAEGELLVKGPFLAMGYYNNPEKTKEVFVQNPLNTAYPETVYRTGDLVKREKDGCLIYMGRKDFQIKHMGYRIEPGEIESNISAMEGIKACVVIYDVEDEAIVLIYQGKPKTDAVMNYVRGKLPAYMHPGVVKKISAMPYNANGKIDRKYLTKNYKTI